MSTLVKTENVSKIYNLGSDNEFEALKSISEEIQQGSFISIMGPSGAGKTTFINNVFTVDLPTSGHVFIEGVNTVSMSAKEVSLFRNETMGFIFQSFNLIDTLTIDENIALPLMIQKRDKKEIKEKVKQRMDEFELTECKNKYPSECSTGQRQRAAIARALITDPKILVCDEPTGNLDSQNALSVLNYLYNLNKSARVTIVMITHSSTVASYSDEMWYLVDGKIELKVVREDLSQREYLDKIIEVTSADSYRFLQTSSQDND